jgi:hypothetical protein
MAFVTGDVIPSEDADFPFKVCFKQGETVIAEWLVKSKDDGEEQIVEALQELADFSDDDHSGQPTT